MSYFYRDFWGEIMRIIFVEGYYDEEFFKMLFRENSDNITFKQYSQEKKEKIVNYIKSINHMPNCDYLFFADSDGKDSIVKIQELQEIYNNLESSKIHIVCYEIESWYCAGLTQDFCSRQKIKYCSHTTDNMSKEQFVDRLPKKMMETSLTIDMLKNYSIQHALEHNISFNKFYNKAMN